MLDQYDAVLLDIEGTTTSIQFVHDVLFPHVIRVLDDFVSEHWNETIFQELIDGLRKQADDDLRNGIQDAIPIPLSATSAEIKAAVAKSVRWQMKIDRKSGPLKAFQGFVWRYAYQNGELKGQVYEDVAPALVKWKIEGKNLYIYSSGSIEAQKLLFGYSEGGDLLHFFSDHFDTGIGMKVEPSSYSEIAARLKFPPTRILFVSDNVNEIRAALEAGFQVAISDRPGNAPLPVDSYVMYQGEGRPIPVIKSFSEFFTSAKF